MVQRHIKSLLYTYDCVIIPDFGGLITHYTPAKIHPVKHTFSPPSKRIAFNEQLKVNDGLLISTLAQQQKWPMSKAQEAVASFVQDLKAQLLEQHQFELNDVGVFRYNAERKLVFENLEGDNFLENSFGLPELVSKPIVGKETLILRGNYQDQTAGDEAGPKKLSHRLRRLYRIGASLVIGGLTVSGLYLLSLQTDVALSSLNPFSMLSTTEAPIPAPVKLEVNKKEETEVDAFAKAYAQKQAMQDSIELVAESMVGQDSVLAQNQENTLKTPSATLDTKLEATPVIAKSNENNALEPETSIEASNTLEAKASNASKAAHTIKSRTGRFYLIMGVFQKPSYAIVNQKRLSKEGYQAKTLVPSRFSRLYKVSVGDYATAEEAQTALNSLRERIGQDLWVLNY